MYVILYICEIHPTLGICHLSGKITVSQKTCHAAKRFQRNGSLIECGVALREPLFFLRFSFFVKLRSLLAKRHERYATKCLKGENRSDQVVLEHLACHTC